MAFRDTFDRCPRCGVTLEDAHSARGCRSCGGAFVEEPVLAEMILQMLPPPPRVFGPLALSEAKRTGSPLACPSCGEAMKPTTIHEVELDHCKKHGVWFDPDELRITLFRVADPVNPPPFQEWVPIAPLPRVPPPPPSRPRPASRRAPTITLGITLPGVVHHRVELDKHIIKIGRLATCDVVIESEAVSRLHAVIEVGAQLEIIDLGSTSGTFVNDQRVTRTALAIGDMIRIGPMQIEILTRSP
jgi:Zn-finger nucleic acid-binding protein